MFRFARSRTFAQHNNLLVPFRMPIRWHGFLYNKLGISGIIHDEKLIKEARDKKIKECHPDVSNKDVEGQKLAGILTAEINAAYTILGNNKHRRHFLRLNGQDLIKFKENWKSTYEIKNTKHTIFDKFFKQDTKKETRVDCFDILYGEQKDHLIQSKKNCYSFLICNNLYMKRDLHDLETRNYEDRCIHHVSDNINKILDSLDWNLDLVNIGNFSSLSHCNIDLKIDLNHFNLMNELINQNGAEPYNFLYKHINTYINKLKSRAILLPREDVKHKLVIFSVHKDFNSSDKDYDEARGNIQSIKDYCQVYLVAFQPQKEIFDFCEKSGITYFVVKKNAHDIQAAIETIMKN